MENKDTQIQELKKRIIEVQERIDEIEAEINHWAWPLEGAQNELQELNKILQEIEDNQ